MTAAKTSTSSFLSEVFTPEQILEQQEEDSQAWWAVAGILFSIVAVGLLLGITAVLLVLRS